MRCPGFTATLLLALALGVQADGPGDNIPDKVRPIPPQGIKIPIPQRDLLEERLIRLEANIALLSKKFAGKPALLDLIPDVKIFHNAVRYAIQYNEIFKPAEIKIAEKLLREGKERADQLHAGQAPWTTATGLVVRGYVSKIDGSVQPYGLVVPKTFRPGTPYRHRLDVWFHGRGETLSELNFLQGRQTSPGEFTPADTFVLHPYGRYCNANHFAGEVDTFEALEHVKRHYPIDDHRLVVRGFSMGGAACWHFAVHHPGLWAAAAPGAGFSETPEFLRTFQNEKLNPTPYEKKLWHMYDCTDYALNLYNCPVVAYSGEIDKQKQAADIMAQAMARESLALVHIIGPGTPHRYHPEAKKEINRRIDAIAARGRVPLPRRVKFTTWTLRYNRMGWVIVDGLEEHWSRARVDAAIVDDSNVRVTTANISALTLAMPSGRCPLEATRRPTVLLDGKPVPAPPVMSDRSWTAHFRKTPAGWVVVDGQDKTLRKRHGLQGPIDDAFMDSFLMVKPTGSSPNPAVNKWVEAELAHAVLHWRKQFRGDARVKDDTEINADNIARHNLVLWGDPAGNKILAKIADKLPIRWNPTKIQAGTREFPAGQHVVLLIYPNPLNPRKYVVLNSGFTYREYDYLNNARQVPKLPDWAIVDLSTPPSFRAPGAVADAGFFDEGWQWKNQPR